jgi:hypothetical protein
MVTTGSVSNRPAGLGTSSVLCKDDEIPVPAVERQNAQNEEMSRDEHVDWRHQFGAEVTPDS